MIDSLKFRCRYCDKLFTKSAHEIKREGSIRCTYCNDPCDETTVVEEKSIRTDVFGYRFSPDFQKQSNDPDAWTEFVD